MIAGVHSVCVELASRFGREKFHKGPPSRLQDYLRTLFQIQRDVLACAARKVAALCTRRAGKTTMVPAALFQAAEENPGCVVIFMGRTRERARELAWENLKAANEEYRLGYAVNEVRLTLRHPKNGAEIRLRGADDIRELEKYRGDKLAFAVIDEAQSFAEAILRKLIEDVLWPALLDVSGRLLLLGTPGYICQGLWYEITRNEDEKSRTERAQGWHVVEWSGLDNPSLNHKGQRICDLFREELESLEADAARGPRHPSVVREYRGRWCQDLKGLYYAFDPERNLYDGTLPEGHHWSYVMGVDIGRAYARVTLAYAETHPVLYEVDGLKEHGTNANRWKTLTRQGQQRLPVEATPVDYGGLGVGIIEAWLEGEDAIPVEPAEKQSKDAFVMLINAELEAGRIKALKGGALAGEWATLPKDPDSPPGKPPQPKPGFDDHSSDAALYAARKALQRRGLVDTPAPRPGSAAARKQAVLEQQEAFLRSQKTWRDETW